MSTLLRAHGKRVEGSSSCAAASRSTYLHTMATSRKNLKLCYHFSCAQAALTGKAHLFSTSSGLRTCESATLLILSSGDQQLLLAFAPTRQQ